MASNKDLLKKKAAEAKGSVSTNKSNTSNTGNATGNKDKDILTSSQQKAVEAAQQKWQLAYKVGDTAGMEAAHKEAEAVRNSAGYKSDASGNYAGTYSSSGSSGGTSYGGGNSQYSTNSIYNPNADYQAYINDAVAKGDFKSAAMYEQLRNQKILGEGLDYETTNLYGNYLDGYTPQKNQQDALSEITDFMQDWYQNNQKPTEPERDPRIDEMLNQILNRDDFSYDVMNDPLYQQYRQMYQREGDRAMRETLAEAASSAGGMNSYAITAAQQANNYYNSQLNDRIPELYQLAYDMYLKDKESQVQDLGILQDMDDTQYNRYRNTMNDWQNDKSFAYGAYNDAVQQGNWQTNFDYGSMWDNINYYTDNSRYNQEWNANQSQLDLENSRYDTEKWEKQLLAVIETGNMPSDDIITKAGWDKAVVEKLVAAAIAEKNKVTYKSSGGGDRISNNEPYIDDVDDEGDGGSPIISDDEQIEVNYSPFERLYNIPAVDAEVQKLLKSKGGKSAVLEYLNEIKATGAIDQSMYNILTKKYLG